MELKDIYEKLVYNITYIREKSMLYKKYRLYQIKKYFVPYNFEYVKKSEDLTIKNKNKEIIYNKKIENSLYNFCTILKNKLPKENLTNFYNNINSLKVFINRTFTKKISDTLGSYNYQKNSIFLNENIDENIYHELMHLTSNCFNKNIENHHCGFMFESKNFNIGYGLNEGYTEFLTHKLFNTDIDSYIFETLVMRYLEQIIGGEKMQDLYFSADLYGLYKELLKYSTEIQTKNFINRLDYYTIRGSKITTGREVEFNLNQENFIINYLINLYNKKIDLNTSLGEKEKNNFKIQFMKNLTKDYDEYYDEIYNYENKTK